MNKDIDYDDPKVEKEWINSQKQNLMGYLEKELIPFNKIDDNPKWFLVPYVIIWQFSNDNNNYWAISGDLPTDYIKFEEANNVKDVLLCFSLRWEKISKFLIIGKNHPDFKIGETTDKEKLKELGVLLKKRAKILKSFSDNDDIWE